MKVSRIAAIVVLGASTFGSETASAQMVARFHTRAPQGCPAVTTQPSPAQAATLIRCRQESMSEGEIYLLDGLKVQLYQVSDRLTPSGISKSAAL
jgi:hypothetical protein